MARNTKPEAMPVDEPAMSASQEEARETTDQAATPTQTDKEAQAGAAKAAPETEIMGAQPKTKDQDPKAPGVKIYRIMYDIRDSRGKKQVKPVTVHARSEAEAFDLAQKALESISTEDNPITWRYTGQFTKG